MISATGM